MADRPNLIAAVHTPLTDRGDLNLTAVEPLAELLLQSGAAGVFPGGTTGESLSLTTDERLALAKRWVDVCAGTDLKVIVHVGHNSLPDAKALAAQAEQIGADAIAAMPPTYFRPESAADVVEFMKELTSSAPGTPFYYYDIPSMTGVNVSMCEFVERADDEIPTLAGIKYSHANFQQLQELLHLRPGKLDLLFGSDEVLLSAWVLGVRGAVGSTYNFLLPVFHRLLADFDRGDLESARENQFRALQIVRILMSYGFLGASKALMGLLGVPLGPVRMPLKNSDRGQMAELFNALEPFADCFPGPLALSSRATISTSSSAR
jgi:N-acetylneuraminate lyase